MDWKELVVFGIGGCNKSFEIGRSKGMPTCLITHGMLFIEDIRRYGRGVGDCDELLRMDEFYVAAPWPHPE